MPSVGLRRTTRVFSVVKGVDGARVLRSGRRLWPESGDGKLRRSSDGDELYQTIIKNTNNHIKNQNSNSNLKYKENNGWTHDVKLKKDRGIVIAIAAPKKIKRVKSEKEKFGIVYSRKRKRLGGEKSENPEDKKFGIQFSRRQRRKGSESQESLVCTPQLVALVEDCSSSNGWLSCFFSSVLRHAMRVSLSLSELADFLLSDPISSIFASNGLHFVRDLPSDRIGICKFFKTRQLLPMFSVDFSAVPSCFAFMHRSLFVKFRCLSLIPVNNSVDGDGDDDDDEIMSESKGDQSCTATKTDFTEKITVVPKTDSYGCRVVLHPSVRASKLTGRNTQHRNGLNSRGIQKRRSSLRRGRPRNSFIAGLHKANGALVSDLISSRKIGIPFSSVVSKEKLRRSIRSSPAASIKEMNCAAVGVKKGMDLSSCSANLLITETDRCYRIEGATVMLEFTDSKEWVLVVKKNGLTRFSHLAQKIMRTCVSNRFTHDIIWNGDGNWKLEFPDRQDWFIFKELYKECSDRNVPASVSKAIPVPGVRGVLDNDDGGSAPFSRPYAYISSNNDELARALSRSTASYDMDSEDEEWLKKYNKEFLAESDHLSEDNFELMIDALERSYFCDPDDFTDESAAAKYCKDFGRRELAKAVYGYWMKKRKQKRSPLLRVFQGHQAKKTPLIPKPVLRKRRSFKRPPSQFGRGKQPSLLQAMAAEKDALHSALRKVEEAKNSVKRSVEAAILKRQKAQLLMKNADLATFKAAMALKIAEAALAASSTDVAVTHFCD